MVGCSTKFDIYGAVHQEHRVVVTINISHSGRIQSDLVLTLKISTNEVGAAAVVTERK